MIVGGSASPHWKVEAYVCVCVCVSVYVSGGGWGICCHFLLRFVLYVCPLA